MTDINTVPPTVNITHYGGDTLTIEVIAPAYLVEGVQWDAQVRATKDSATIDGTFEITPPAVEGGPAYLMLPAATAAALVASAPLVGTVRRYIGFWDCQISDAGSDPVCTLVQGQMTIEVDVTRLVAP